ncbi:DNA recombination protein RmuC [bacterium]|nr:DNA recombination protein RmuC [bacterium]
MFSSDVIFILAAVAGLAILLGIQINRINRKFDDERNRSGALENRLSMLQDSVERARQDSQILIAEELRQSRRELAAEQETGRKEARETLEVFRGSLEQLRVTLSQDQTQARTESRDTLTQTVAALSEQFAKLQQSNEQRLIEIQRRVDEKLSETITRNDTLFKGVSDRLTELHVTNEKIQRFSQELEELQSILKAPKLRGELGEVEMERMLRDCLHPEQYDIQHQLGGGRVDAVIINPQGKLPVDSKFPLEAYNRLRAASSDNEAEVARKEFVRSVKKHVDDIANKYIQPPETLLFAVMYVPAEGVYYELLSIPELMEYARIKGVFPTSPTSFWALLQVTVIGFKGMKISENAQRISALLRGLTGDLEKVKTSFAKAANQVRLANNNMSEASGDLDQLDRKIFGIQQAGDVGGLTAGEVPGLPTNTDGSLWQQ